MPISFNRAGNGPACWAMLKLFCRSTRGALPARLNDRITTEY